jgi:hypothetical protein
MMRDEGIDQFAIQTLLAEATNETFHVSILPWTSWIDIEGFDLIVFEPLLDSASDEGPPMAAGSVATAWSIVPYFHRVAA